ncbi:MULTISPECIES: hypothetical protein [Streptomyces]|uniref:hypothetical protein n=1 Tax=Streptomyces TaxID=1883 RepID=UPI001F30DCFC|nr:hypothetical protein [Streptomyces noursei]MCE4941846.1 hypothetical protein [Streptomyces noursei]
MYIAKTSPVLNVENNASGGQFSALSRGIAGASIAFDEDDFESDEMAGSNTLTHVNGRGRSVRGQGCPRVIVG